MGWRSHELALHPELAALPISGCFCPCFKKEYGRLIAGGTVELTAKSGRAFLLFSQLHRRRGLELN